MSEQRGGPYDLWSVPNARFHDRALLVESGLMDPSTKSQSQVTPDKWMATWGASLTSPLEKSMTEEMQFTIASRRATLTRSPQKSRRIAELRTMVKMERDERMKLEAELAACKKKMAAKGLV